VAGNTAPIPSLLSLPSTSSINAVTRASQDEADYDAATDLERVGGQLITLAPTEWRALNSAN
jgi:hypothetical protein